MTASWLLQMGWKDVAVLVATGTETGFPAAPILGGAPSRDHALDATELAALMARDAVTIVDLSLSRDYRRGHIPGAWFAIRARLAQALAKIPATENLVLTSEDGTLAALAVREAQTAGYGNVRYLAGGNAAWKAAGHALSADDPRMADEAVDVWLKPYERASGVQDAMNEYLTWEVDLLERIRRDDSVSFYSNSSEH
jgi:rhodanese-related sulfurtransferase